MSQMDLGEYDPNSAETREQFGNFKKLGVLNSTIRNQQLLCFVYIFYTLC